MNIGALKLTLRFIAYHSLMNSFQKFSYYSRKTIISIIGSGAKTSGYLQLISKSWTYWYYYSKKGV